MLLESNAPYQPVHRTHRRLPRWRKPGTAIGTTPRRPWGLLSGPPPPPPFFSPPLARGRLEKGLQTPLPGRPPGPVSPLRLLDFRFQFEKVSSRLP